MAEVAGGGVAFGAEEGGEVGGAAGEVDVLLEGFDGGFLAVAIFPVAAQEGAAVLDLGDDEAAGEPQAGGFVKAGAVLGGAQFDVLVAGADGVAVEPAAVAVPGDGDLAGHEFVEGGGGDVDVAHEDELGDFVEAYGALLFVVDGDFEGFAALGDFGAVGLDVDGEGFLEGDGEGAGRRLLGAEEVDFVGQADADEGAAGAFGAVHQRGGDLAAGGDEAQAVDGVAGEGVEFVVEFHRDPLAGFGVVEHAAAAGVAVLLEDEPLHAELHAFGVVGAAGDVGAFAAFVVHGGDGAVGHFEQVEPGDEPECAAGERDGAGVDALFLLQRLGGGEIAAGLIHPPMHVLALHRVARIRPLALHPLQVGEPGAVLVLVDHAGGEQGQIARQFREGQGELGLQRGGHGNTHRCVADGGGAPGTGLGGRGLMCPCGVTLAQ